MIAFMRWLVHIIGWTFAILMIAGPTLYLLAVWFRLIT